MAYVYRVRGKNTLAADRSTTHVRVIISLLINHGVCPAVATPWNSEHTLSSPERTGELWFRCRLRLWPNWVHRSGTSGQRPLLGRGRRGRPRRGGRDTFCCVRIAFGSELRRSTIRVEEDERRPLGSRLVAVSQSIENRAASTSQVVHYKGITYPFQTMNVPREDCCGRYPGLQRGGARWGCYRLDSSVRRSGVRRRRLFD